MGKKYVVEEINDGDSGWGGVLILAWLIIIFSLSRL